MTKRYDAVIFDAAGTLLGTNVDSPYWYEQFFVDACHEKGYRHITVEDVKTSLLNAKQADLRFQSFWHDPQLIQQFWEHTYSSVFALLCPNHCPKTLAANYINRFSRGDFSELFSDAKPALEYAKSKQIKIGLVSNFGPYLGDILERLDINRYFDFVIISACVGCAKPDMEIFQLAHTYVQDIPKDRILFVGDSENDDYSASQNFGFKPLLIDRWHLYSGAISDIHKTDSLKTLESYY